MSSVPRVMYTVWPSLSTSWKSVPTLGRGGGGGLGGGGLGGGLGDSGGGGGGGGENAKVSVGGGGLGVGGRGVITISVTLARDKESPPVSTIVSLCESEIMKVSLSSTKASFPLSLESRYMSHLFSQLHVAAIALSKDMDCVYWHVARQSSPFPAIGAVFMPSAMDKSASETVSTVNEVVDADERRDARLGPVKVILRIVFFRLRRALTICRMYDVADSSVLDTMLCAALGLV